jgi:hypothetical protein
MDTLIKDIRYGVRSFLKRPGFLFIAISTLALGIGATTAMFTVLNSVLLRPLQFPEPERIMRFDAINTRHGFTEGPMSVPDLVDCFNPENVLVMRLSLMTEASRQRTALQAPNRSSEGNTGCAICRCDTESTVGRRHV